MSRAIEVICDADFSARYPVSREYMTIEDMVALAVQDVTRHN